LTLDKKRYVLQYGLLYSGIIAIILIVPFYVYIMLMININETKSALELKQKAHEIIVKMDAYRPSHDSYFTFPRYNRFKAGLYDSNFNPIFSLLEKNPVSFQEGYHEYGTKRYYLLPFSNKHFFGAKYLLIEGDVNNFEIYKMALLIGLSILLLLFLVSYFVFKNFALPFEEVNQKLDNFIKDSMHEINTPLSIINVNIDMFTRNHGDNKYLTRIKAASKTLATIYNDMDYLIKQDRIQFEKESINMSLFAQERVDYFKDVARLRDIKIQTEIEEDITLYFNKTKLQRIIDNTISNAVKYSHEKSEINVRLHYKDEKIIFAVEDYGVGIENPQMIFERYYRENLNKGGFGIGLNIVKKIIDEHDIVLKIISSKDIGSEFCYIFPTQ